MKPEEIDPDLFEPFSQMVPIEVMGKQVEVPENNMMLRCFQYLSMSTITYGKFCWNNDCGNCECQVVFPGTDEVVTRRMCCTRVVPGVKVVGTSRHVRLKI